MWAVSRVLAMAETVMEYAAWNLWLCPAALRRFRLQAGEPWLFPDSASRYGQPTVSTAMSARVDLGTLWKGLKSALV